MSAISVNWACNSNVNTKFVQLHFLHHKYSSRGDKRYCVHPCPNVIVSPLVWRYCVPHCPKSVSMWTLRKIPSLPLVFEIVLFQSFPKIHDRRWWSEKRPILKLTACGVWRVQLLGHHKAKKLTQNWICFIINVLAPSPLIREYGGIHDATTNATWPITASK